MNNFSKFILVKNERNNYYWINYFDNIRVDALEGDNILLIDVFDPDKIYTIIFMC